jgi:hypothetical protein
LTHLGDYSLGLTFLAEMSQQQQYPSEPLFAGIEKLINQILFVCEIDCASAPRPESPDYAWPVLSTNGGITAAHVSSIVLALALVSQVRRL